MGYKSLSVSSICSLQEEGFSHLYLSSKGQIQTVTNTGGRECQYKGKVAKKQTVQFSSVQSLSCVQIFAAPWTAAHQASLFFTISLSLLNLMSIELVMPSNHLIFCHPLLLLPSTFPRIRDFSNESAFASGGQSIGASASASVLPLNIQD